MKQLLNKHQYLFASSAGNLGLTSMAELHKIETQNAAPMKQLSCRLPYALRPDVEAQVKEMLERNVIRPSNSPWSSLLSLFEEKKGHAAFA